MAANTIKLESFDDKTPVQMTLTVCSFLNLPVRDDGNPDYQRIVDILEKHVDMAGFEVHVERGLSVTVYVEQGVAYLSQARKCWEELTEQARERRAEDSEVTR